MIYAYVVKRNGARSADLAASIVAAKNRGVIFDPLAVPGKVWANELPNDAPPLLKTLGYIWETEEPGKYRVRMCTDARNSDHGLVANLAWRAQRDGLPGFGRIGLRSPLLINRSSKTGHAYLHLARPLSDYHHMELRAIAAIPDTVPDALTSNEGTHKGVQDSHAPTAH